MAKSNFLETTHGKMFHLSVNNIPYLLEIQQKYFNFQRTKAIKFPLKEDFLKVLKG